MAGHRKPVRLVKKSHSTGEEPVAKSVVTEPRHAIQSWIKEFRRKHRPTAFPAFSTLFKEELKSEPELPVDRTLVAEAE
ncbi:MAG TPA: hypothetical protein VFD63_04025 [Pyrinomonadaceae bacterium]|jgi:hypothetical protein|nr:hypothetical protein [Pyrinomonadaceae bacterium]